MARPRRWRCPGGRTTRVPRGPKTTHPAVAALLAVVALLAGSARAAAEPTVELSTSAASIGETIVVTVNGWSAPTTAAVCGNLARRGAVDCDLVGSVGLPPSAGAPQRRELLITAPPAPCPCVIRVADVGDHAIQMVAIELRGAPVGAVTDDVSPGNERGLRVTARLVRGRASIVDHLRSGLGGRTRRTLVLVLRNRSRHRIAEASITAALARSAAGGKPVAAPRVAALEPGASRRVDVEIQLAAPAFGTYVVYGTVRSNEPPVDFVARTSTTPWLLVLLLLALVADIAAIVLVRWTRRHP